MKTNNQLHSVVVGTFESWPKGPKFESQQSQKSIFTLVTPRDPHADQWMWTWAHNRKEPHELTTAKSLLGANTKYDTAWLGHMKINSGKEKLEAADITGDVFAANLNDGKRTVWGSWGNAFAPTIHVWY